MNKTTRIVAIILCVLTLLGTLLPLAVNAQNIDSSNYVYLDFSNKADEQIVLIDNDTETTETETESNDNWDGLCEVNVVLNSEITEKTDNIEIRFTPKGSLIANDSVVLSRSNDFKGQIKLVPGEYSIAFTKADNKYEVVINENFVKVPEAKKIELTLTAKKVQNGSFLATFFRNNTFLLILLAASSITYYILRKRRLANVYDTGQRD